MSGALAFYATNPAAADRLSAWAERVDAAMAGMADTPAGLRRLLERSATAAVIMSSTEGASALRALRAAVGDVPVLVLLEEGASEAPVEPLLAASQHEIAEAGESPLTPREVDVLRALADGASNKMIARRLGISFHTVKFYVASILAKLDAETRAEAVAQGVRLGLVML